MEEGHYPTRGLKIIQWANFTNCDRLEVLFRRVNDDKRGQKSHIMQLIQHPNLHVLIDEPFEANDACPPNNMRYWSGYWKKSDVDNFVNSIAMSSTKTLTYTLQKDSQNPETVTFECDEQFSSNFMAFLDTQPIYIGKNHESAWGEKYFVTLESAKQSFLQ